MCGSSIRTSTSSPTWNGSARSSISLREPESTTSNVSSGSASPPSKWKCFPHAVGDVLTRHLDQAERRDVHHVALRLVDVERLSQRLQDLVAVARPSHVDEVDDDDAADVAKPELAH